MRRSPLLIPVFTAASALLAAAGCNSDAPEVAPVEGTVTLDGQPIEGAMVRFSPVAGGRPSAGRTDSDGWYELVYSREMNGALPGEHVVRISTYVEGDPESGDEGVPERIPAKYNLDSELKREVKADDNVIDFKLDSEGEIREPPKEG